MQLAICKQCWLKNIFDMAGLSELFTYNGCNRDITNFIMLRYRDQFIQVGIKTCHVRTVEEGAG